MVIPEKYYLEPDILLAHKPSGWTSFDLVRKLRSTLGVKKVGHAGTLDPLARGLMIIGIGSGTKKMASYTKLAKVYLADIYIGKSTTTLDLEGETLKEVPVNHLSAKEISEAVSGLKGEHHIQVPRYSAIKVQGKPLYWYARNNIEPPYMPTKEMKVKKVQLLDSFASNNAYIIKIRIDVSSGTYIRSLAEELGKNLGYPAFLQGLYRYTIGDYCDKDAFHISQEAS